MDIKFVRIHIYLLSRQYITMADDFTRKVYFCFLPSQIFQLLSIIQSLRMKLFFFMKVAYKSNYQSHFEALSFFSRTAHIMCITFV